MGLTVVVPDRNPCKLLMAEQQVQIGAVSGIPLAVIVEREDVSVRQRHAANALAPAIFAVLVLVDVVAQVNDVVDRVLAGRVSVCIEEAERYERLATVSIHSHEAFHVRKLLQEYTARPILDTLSFAAGVVLVRPSGLVLFELQTLN